MAREIAAPKVCVRLRCRVDPGRRMIRANVQFSDLAVAPVREGDAVRVGSGQFVPYRHRALETLLVRAHLQWFMVVRERAADRSSAESFQDVTVDGERFRHLYREALLWPLDYVMVEVAQHGGRLKLRAGPLGIAPVYCRTTDESVSLSYDALDLLDRPTTVDPEIVSRQLALNADYSARQMICGVLMLTERAVLHAERGRVHYRYPADADVPPRPSRAQERDRPEPEGAFERRLRQAVLARPSAVDRIAVELSGGLDSATVACALRSAHGGAIASLGILLDRASGGDQMVRRRKIVERLDLHDHTLDIDAAPPSLDLRPDPARREYPFPEFYLEAFENLWDKARAQEREFVFTGIGGDQLFPLFGDESHSVEDRKRGIVAAAKASAERLLTPRARSAARTVNGMNAPRSLLPASVLISYLCQAPHLLRRGLWPVNPLGDPELYAHCCALPVGARRNRDTMHRFVNARLGPDVFAPDYEKETFAHVLPGRIARQADAIASQLRECALADLGLVDRDAVLALLDELVATRARHLTTPLITVLWLERFLRRIL